MSSYYCSMCDDTGIVMANRKDTPTAPYVFKCNCNRGQWDKRAYTSWASADRNIFELAPKPNAPKTDYKARAAEVISIAERMEFPR